MEQGGVSIIPPTSLTDNSTEKGKSNGIIHGSKMLNAKEKLRAPWIRNLLNEEQTIWQLSKLGLAEVVGTAILVFLGCMSAVGGMGTATSGFKISLSFGFAVTVAIQCVGHISGAHINPSITVGAVILGQKSLQAAAVYIVSQCFGAILGFGLLKLVTPDGLLHGGDPDASADFCVTLLHSDLSVFQGFIAEFLATGILMMVACGVWDMRNSSNTDSAAIRFGLAVAVLCVGFGPYTACGMNPARSLAPAIFNNRWADHWVYWLGPIGGAALGAFFYKIAFGISKEVDTIDHVNSV